MSSRRRRKRGGNNANDGNQANANQGNAKQGNQSKQGKNRSGGGSAKTGKKSGRQKNKQKTPKFDAADFWGDNELLPETRGYVVDIDDTTATLRSLGRPPIPGSEAAAEHHFAMVYERSVNMARALAAAGGLDQESEESEETEA